MKSMESMKSRSEVVHLCPTDRQNDPGRPAFWDKVDKIDKVDPEAWTRLTLLTLLTPAGRGILMTNETQYKNRPPSFGTLPKNSHEDDGSDGLS